MANCKSCNNQFFLKELRINKVFKKPLAEGKKEEDYLFEYICNNCNNKEWEKQNENKKDTK